MVVLGLRINRDDLENEATPIFTPVTPWEFRLSLLDDRLVKLRVELIGHKEY